MMSSGLFITVEGGEGTGKSTLVNSLYTYITEKKGRFVVKTFEPGSTVLGKEIRNILLHRKELIISGKSELFLFLADRAHHVEMLIKPALGENLVVICDRFIDSSIAYQGAAREVSDLDEIEKICLFATGDLVPDITFFLDLDPKVGLARIKGEKDRLEKEVIDFHQRVREGYQEIARKHNNRVHTLDASKAPDQVFKDAVKILEEECTTLL
jgi:dTMP kinase